ncbi:MAG: hypothetical protein M3460_27485, partial [Actinomycetota bacterium]|nr:hypothetical protein [Actinomycetota bacterium]
KRKSGKTRHGNRWLRGALGTAAMAAARTKDKTYLGARYQRGGAGRGGAASTARLLWVRADLAAARDVGIERSHQVHDLPEVHITVWQHDVYRVRCGCGAEHVGQLPEEVSTAPSATG